MARKVVSRKEKRAEFEASEAAGKKKKAPAKKKAVKKKAAKRAPRKKKAPEVIRMKAYWGVFSQSLKRVALYDYVDRKKAEKRAKELSESGNKSPHFVQPVKEAIVEE